MINSWTSIIGAFAVSLAASFWAFEAVVLMPYLYDLPTLFVVFILHALPFLVMQFFFYKQYKYLKILSKKDLFFFVLLAISGGILGTYCITKALFLMNFQQLTIVALLQKLQPIFAIILARFFLGEKIKKENIFWILLAILSSYFLSFGFQTPEHAENNVVQAVVFSVLAAFFYGSQTVWGKKAIEKVPPITGTFYRLGFTTFILGFFLIFQSDFWENFSKITFLHAEIFAIIGLFSSGLGLTLYYFGLKKIKANVATICEMMYIVSAVFFDYLLHKTQLSWPQIISAFILVFSIYRLSSKKRKK